MLLIVQIVKKRVLGMISKYDRVFERIKRWHTKKTQLYYRMLHDRKNEVALDICGLT